MKPVFSPADLLLPVTEYEKWSVIACDQFTSQPEYWQEAEKIVGDAPSTLRITLPEVYLGEGAEERIAAINRTMLDYCSRGVLREVKDAMVYVERETRDGLRRGLVGTVDLADYDYHAGAASLIRATEQTVLERIPPRVRIRKDATLELPHVLLLFDDPENTVFSALAQNEAHLSPAYDFDLMLSGGHIRGQFLDAAAQAAVQKAIEALQKNCGGLLFAVGDGNHSLATAKECAALCDAPAAQKALVELVNIHDPSLIFEPIYRVLFHADAAQVLADCKASLGAGYTGADAQRLTVMWQGGEESFAVRPGGKLTVATLQSFLDGYLREHPALSIDYIHGEDTVRDLCSKAQTVGFLFEGMKKEELFDAVRADGALPRKTFSMGHAQDKRYYLEARRIR